LVLGPLASLAFGKLIPKGRYAKQCMALIGVLRLFGVPAAFIRKHRAFF
jgi:hypothetical protein